MALPEPVAAYSADDVMADLDRLNEEAQRAIADAFDSPYVAGFAVQAGSNSGGAEATALTVSVAEGRAWPATTVGLERRAVQAVMAAAVDVGTWQQPLATAANLVIGLIASEIADGLALPIVVDDGVTNDWLPDCVPLAFVQTDFGGVSVVRDLRQPPRQWRMAVGSGTDLQTGGLAGTGAWQLIGDLILSVVTRTPNEDVEVRLFANIGDAVSLAPHERDRGIELGLVVDKVDPGGTTQPTRTKIVTTVPSLPAAPTVQVTIPVGARYVSQGLAYAWVLRNYAAATVQMTQSTSNPPPSGQYFVDDGGLYTFAAADAGASVTIWYWYQYDQTTGPFWEAQSPRQTLWAMRTLTFATPGHHTIEVAARGTGKVDTVTLMARVFPRQVAG